MLTVYKEHFPNDLTSQVSREDRDPVASGRLAYVYRGMLQHNGQSIKVAIKTIKAYSGEDGNFSKKQNRLWQEINLWLTLRHANVLPILGTTMSFGQFPAMVFPWVENGTLTSYLEDHDDNCLCRGQIFGLLKDVASGLQYLHSRSIVHGNLSGTNVLICENGSAYISDYGLSMLLTELGGSTFATPFHVWGTLRWTAPELLDLEDDTDEESSRVAPTTQSDVYSFGSIMLQILSGKVPYHYYKHELQVLYAISKGKTPLRPSGIARQRITERQWMFIQQCWSTVNITRSRPSSEDIVEFTERQLADWHTWWLSFLFSARCRSYSLAPPPHSPPEGNNRVLEIDNETGSAPSSSTSDDESSSITDNDLDLVCSYGKPDPHQSQNNYPDIIGIPTSCCYPQTRAGRVSLPVATDTSD
ncbi:kinase-like domain-containing protein, partial [Boletus edulis BED1]